MNHVYRIVWNHVACTWQAVAESAKGFGKGRQGESRAHLSLQPSPKFSIKPLLAALSLISSSAWAGPQGGQVVAGSATIQQAGNTTTINQSTNRAAIDWTSFSVGKAESVRFNQPSTSAITLNRVTGTESSQILGSMSANGQVFILNPNGVLFGKGAQVNVGGLVASTHGMSNADFMDGNYQLSGNGTGAVINQGKITVIEGGTIALIAPIVKNTGTLTANGGSVLLAAADAVSLKLQDGSLIGYTLDKGSLQALVDNGGVIHAEGGHVVLTAKALDALSKATINHSGIIEAQTVANKNGVVELLGDMQVGEIKLSGKIDASAPNGGDGGFVETSAANIDLNQPHWVSTLSKYGKTGRWLIDPNDFVIGSGGNITAQGLHDDLAHGDIAFATATQGTAGGNGDIFVNEAVSWSSHKLTLSAGRNILINASLTASGSASLALEYGQSNVASGNTANYFINNGAKVTLPAGQSFSTKLGSDGATDIYTVITSLGVAGDTSNTTLQGIKNNLNGKYALGDDIDASATAGWNSGSGWEPIGQASWFRGVIDGLGHTIRGLSASRSTSNKVAFIGSNAGMLRNIRLADVNFVGNEYVGSLAGVSGGSIFNVYATGNATGTYGVGGLAGLIAGDVESSAVAMNVRGDTHVGGFAGLVGNDAYIINCYSGGKVISNTGTPTAGGFAGTTWAVSGHESSIVNSYSNTVVDSTGGTGGFVAYNIGGLTVNNSYWDTEMSGQSSSALGVGKTTAEMKQRGTFTGWDFANTWQIVEGSSYPTLTALASDSCAGCVSASVDPDANRYTTAILGSLINNTTPNNTYCIGDDCVVVDNQQNSGSVHNRDRLLTNPYYFGILNNNKILLSDGWENMPDSDLEALATYIKLHISPHVGFIDFQEISELNHYRDIEKNAANVFFGSEKEILGTVLNITSQSLNVVGAFTPSVDDVNFAIQSNWRTILSGLANNKALMAGLESAAAVNNSDGGDLLISIVNGGLEAPQIEEIFRKTPTAKILKTLSIITSTVKTYLQNGEIDSNVGWSMVSALSKITATWLPPGNPVKVGLTVGASITDAYIAGVDIAKKTDQIVRANWDAIDVKYDTKIRDLYISFVAANSSSGTANF